ncbi:LOW QUALITY PROTEIN: syndetin-like [Liolophura sinensis]|uniref:LOW QUALITY PROTEIN: syndetin-like n=1 Tax=Liolophura sinensis TaxID=3198878 RepID=UPI0031583A44
MDLKKKLISFISRQDSAKSPVDDDVSSLQLSADPALTKFKEHINEYPNDPQADREVIESIETVYYNDETFDASEYELNKLPETLEMVEINKDRERLRRQHQAVSKKVSELVLQNHPAYNTELQRVMELQKALQSASVICANGRRHLDRAKTGFTTASLGLLANYRKRQQLQGLLKSLRTIKTLQSTEIRLREMLEEEDYAGAIQLCLECQKAASTFRHFKCISELNAKLQDTLEMIEEQLDVALSRTCTNFDHVHYSKVQTAYRMLGKTQTAMDQLHMHYASAIHNTAFTIVLGYVELCAGHMQANFQKRQYPDLCKFITGEVFIPCLIGLCKALWEVMKSYHMTIEWHEGLLSEAETLGSNVEATFNRHYIKQKLEHGLGRIWQDVQQKVKTYILATDLSSFKFDEFIQVLDLVNRLILIGEEFCGSKSEGLQDSLKRQSLNYFRNYHRARMEELRMFLENEGWEICPVKSNFTILQLLEFRFMRNWSDPSKPSTVNGLGASTPSKSSNTMATTTTVTVPDSAMSMPTSTSKPENGYFQKFKGDGNPFDIQKDEEEHEDVLATNGMDDSGFGYKDDSDSDSDVPDELKQEFIDELAGETTPAKRSLKKLSRSRSNFRPAPIITNTTLNVVRVFGKYMQMMTYLKPIAFDVILCMSQLFDYYLYTVYTYFGTDLPELNSLILSNRTKITLQRIEDSLIMSDNVAEQAARETVTIQGDKMPPPQLSSITGLMTPDRLYGLAERVVAAESLMFLAAQFEFLHPHLDAMIPPNKKAFLHQFYSQTVEMCHELRRPIYGSVAAQAIDYDKLQQLMSAVKWDVKEIMSQHNVYVDVILKEFSSFEKRMVEILKQVPLPKAVHDTLWEQCVRIANRTFVEGYASAKKCTNEGRALMQLDFQQYITKLEKLTDVRPLPDRDFVESYIKAYYLPEAQLEQWVREHKVYSPKQLIALVNCIDHISKKARQRLTNIVEELDKPRR